MMMRRALRHRLVRRILPDIYAESARKSELVVALTRLAQARRAAGTALIERALARGELNANIDVKIALDMIPSALYWRIIVTNRSMSKAQIE
ncbi:TetR-like C-terminal domain-containing protein [Rhizobium sp. WCS2018Hpa-8]|uniref:TetR-like C-terminal domain-containing protein n=2 Tax=unclassified Rhizobium TaxID=2613769 RepID=UPI001F25D210|nr:TetR-like C-terminal domain-containing protein [Rhizobium sp. WCS2018Hpa-8]